MIDNTDTTVYDKTNVSTMAPAVYGALPEWINTTFSNFPDFLNYYYKFVAGDTEIDQVLDNLNKNKAAAETDESLIDSLYTEYANYIPEGYPGAIGFPTKRELLLKIVSTLYNSRGTVESAKKFFSIFYGDPNATITPFKVEDFTINLFNDTDLLNKPKAKLWEPFTYIIRTSASIADWYEPYIKIIHPVGYKLISLITYEGVAGQSGSTTYESKDPLRLYPNQMNNPTNWRSLPELNFGFGWDQYKYLTSNSLSFGTSNFIYDNVDMFYDENSPADSPVYESDIKIHTWLEGILPTYGADHCPTMQPGLLQRNTLLNFPTPSIKLLVDPVPEGEWGAYIVQLDATHFVDEAATELLVTVEVAIVTRGAVVRGSWNDNSTFSGAWIEEDIAELARNGANNDSPLLAPFDEKVVLAPGYWSDTNATDNTDNEINDAALIPFNNYAYTETDNLPRYDYVLDTGILTTDAVELSSYVETPGNDHFQDAQAEFAQWKSDYAQWKIDVVADPALTAPATPTGMVVFPTFANQSSYKDKTFSLSAKVTVTFGGEDFELSSFTEQTISNTTTFPPIPDNAEILKTNTLT
jgi:hypothetical protein